VQELIMTPEERDLTAQVTAARMNSGAFRAFAVFDERLDCIRVQWRDCSHKEIRVSPLLTIVVDNYPESRTPECVGFTIKGVAHICESKDIPSDVPWKLADFLDALMTMDKPMGRYTLQKDIRPKVEEKRIETVEREVAV
jgi:hypothetical protein